MIIRALITPIILLGLLLGTVSSALAGSDVRSMRKWQDPDKTRLVLDLSGPVRHNLFAIDNPHRLVLDIFDARLAESFKLPDFTGSPIKRVRSSESEKKLRLVLDLQHKVSMRTLELKPNDTYGDRLVVDIFTDKPARQVKSVSPVKPGKLRDIVVFIDAGHGGEDPGAIGAGRVREKDVVLEIAKEVKRLIDQEEGFTAELTRTGDYFISLRGRTKQARMRNADLFVSIHADAFKDSRARGASVWTLSNRGATSTVGRWLMQKENNADLIGGAGSAVSLEDKDDTLAGVLVDMSITASRVSSVQVASRIHENIGQFAKMHKGYVEQAGFLVLKSPDVPSVLVETGFISNPHEAKLLSTASYRKKMAQAIYAGIKGYFWEKPPEMTYLAHLKQAGRATESGRTYKVARGDTLSVIASRHGVSLKGLRQINAIKGDKIRVGQVLQIPAS